MLREKGATVKMTKQVLHGPLNAVPTTTWINAILHVEWSNVPVFHLLNLPGVIVCVLQAGLQGRGQLGQLAFRPTFKEFSKGYFRLVHVIGIAVVFGKGNHPGFTGGKITDCVIYRMTFVIPAFCFSDAKGVPAIAWQLDNGTVTVRISHLTTSFLACYRCCYRCSPWSVTKRDFPKFLNFFPDEERIDEKWK